MKIKMKFLLISIFIFVLVCNPIVANAINTGFLISELPEEDQINFVKNIELCLIEAEPPKSPVVCFDVNEKQMIAVGQNSSDRKVICVYSSDGSFQYGYTFYCSGTFGVEWDNDNLNIYFVRSDVIISVSPDGEISDVLEVANSIENNSYVNHFFHATERTIGDTTYFIRNDMGILNCIATSFSQIVIKDVSGTENVIYDVNSTQLLKTLLITIFVFVFVIVAITIILRPVIKSMRIKRAPKIETNVKKIGEIKTEFETLKINAEIVDLNCRVEMIGIKQPKTVTFFTVCFETDNNERIKINVPQEMYDGLEVGQKGELTLVDGELYSFII